MTDIKEIHRALEKAARLDLIAEVADRCYDASESWDPQAGGLGVQFAYLFYSIAASPRVLFSEEGEEQFCRFMGTLFPLAHRVWDFIEKIEEEPAPVKPEPDPTVCPYCGCTGGNLLHLNTVKFTKEPPPIRGAIGEWQTLEEWQCRGVCGGRSFYT
jgi:hypothetical protein